MKMVRHHQRKPSQDQHHPLGSPHHYKMYHKGDINMLGRDVTIVEGVKSPPNGSQVIIIIIHYQ